MSQLTKDEFKKLVVSYYHQYKDRVALSYPIFTDEGFITLAVMTNSSGSVELMCGPPEYHIELFINTFKNNKRWNLADLVGVKIVKDWLVLNPPDLSRYELLEAEVSCIFNLISVGISKVDDFNWINPAS